MGRHIFWVWKAFTDLNYRRGVGMSGPVPISYTDIEAYCSLKGIYSLGERERLLRLLDPLDRQWMADAHAAAEAQAGRKKGALPPAEPPHTAAPRSGPRKKTQQVA